MTKEKTKTVCKAVFISFTAFFPILLEMLFEQIPSIASAANGFWFAAKNILGYVVLGYVIAIVLSVVAGLLYVVWAAMQD